MGKKTHFVGLKISFAGLKISFCGSNAYRCSVVVLLGLSTVILRSYRQFCGSMTNVICVHKSVFCDSREVIMLVTNSLCESKNVFLWG